MILVPVIKMELEETDNLPNTVRGEGGFGSTGKSKTK
jgi:dUTP pyrophosphatase